MSSFSSVGGGKKLIHQQIFSKTGAASVLFACDSGIAFKAGKKYEFEGTMSRTAGITGETLSYLVINDQTPAGFINPDLDSLSNSKVGGLLNISSRYGQSRVITECINSFVTNGTDGSTDPEGMGVLFASGESDNTYECVLRIWEL